MFTHNIEIRAIVILTAGRISLCLKQSPSARCFALLSMTLIIGVNSNIIIKITY